MVHKDVLRRCVVERCCLDVLCTMCLKQVLSRRLAQTCCEDMMDTYLGKMYCKNVMRRLVLHSCCRNVVQTSMRVVSGKASVSIKVALHSGSCLLLVCLVLKTHILLAYSLGLCACVQYKLCALISQFRGAITQEV